jgi:hypothetical protein
MRVDNELMLAAHWSARHLSGDPGTEPARSDLSALHVSIRIVVAISMAPLKASKLLNLK